MHVETVIPTVAKTVTSMFTENALFKFLGA